jgi:hypothetical protein
MNYDRDKLQTRLVNSLQKMEPLREPILQDLSEKTFKRMLTVDNHLKAALIQVVGDAADDPCSRCESGKGVFKGCFRLQGIWVGACANCIWARGRHSGKCDVRGMYALS